MFKSRDDEELVGQVGVDDGLDLEAEFDAKPEPVSAYKRLLQKTDETNKAKGYMNVLGMLADQQASIPTAYESLYNKKRSGPMPSEGLSRAASLIEDPSERAQKAMAFLKQKREMTQMSGADDPNSQDSLAFAEQVGGMFPQFAKYVKGKSKAQIQEMMPILSQKARGDEDRNLRAMDMQMRREDRQEARADRLDAKAMKQKELSAAQAKQRGLYEIGKKAEEQFSSAKGAGYDPTSVTEVIDNSKWAPNWLKNDKAVASQGARDAWIESFLRDASGAAIPDSERAAYGRIYFPQPGDTPDVVKNKAALRAQKMESARIAAGVETGHGPSVAEAPASPSGMVEMIAPNGKVKLVKESDVQAAIAAGGKLKNAGNVGSR